MVSMSNKIHEDFYKSRFIHWLSTITGWIIRVFQHPNRFKNHSRVTLSLFEPLLKYLDKVYSSQGKRRYVKTSKIVRQNIFNFLSGNPERIPGCKLTRRRKLPRCLGDELRDRLANVSRTGFDPAIPILLTILTASRCLKVGGPVKTESIEEGFKSLHYTNLPLGEVVLQLRPYVNGFLSALGLRSQQQRKKFAKTTLWSEWHMSAKSGPNGHALGKWREDLLSLPLSLRKDLELFGGPDFSHMLMTADGFLKASGYKPKFRKGASQRKIVSFYDKEDKIRIIAILDYFSQTVLKPLHHSLFGILKRIPQDFTFDQDRFRDFIGSIEEGTTFYSYDLSAATDRMPLSLILEVLSPLLEVDEKSTERSRAWKNIMVGYPFDIGPHPEPKKLSYGVGNPMGAYSSWSSFTLAHHFLIYVSCRLSLKSWKSSKYWMLGDDIVIYDDDVALAYKELVSLLGVHVSEAKTHCSKEFFEFAKRYFYQREEISPFPIGSFRNHQLFSIVEGFKASRQKGYWLTDSIQNACIDYLSSVCPIRKGKAELSATIELVLFSSLFLKDSRISETFVPRGYSVPLSTFSSTHWKVVFDTIAWFIITNKKDIRKMDALQMSCRTIYNRIEDLSIKLDKTFPRYNHFGSFPSDLRFHPQFHIMQRSVNRSRSMLWESIASFYSSESMCSFLRDTKMFSSKIFSMREDTQREVVMSIVGQRLRTLLLALEKDSYSAMLAIDQGYEIFRSYVVQNKIFR